MLECPFCRQRVAHEGRDKWFECPVCRNWIRLRVNQNGSTWYEMGVLVNETIQPVQLVRQHGQPAQVPIRGQNQALSRNLPNLNDMDLPAVRSLRQRVSARLSELENNIQRVINLRTQNRQSEPLTRQYNAELSQLTQEQNELQQYQQRLSEREAGLQEEVAQTRQTSSSGPGLVFGCGTILAGAGIFIFTRMINLHLDPRAYMILIVIAVVSGLLTLLIAQVD